MRSSGVLRARLFSALAASLLACGAPPPPRLAPSPATSAPAVATPRPSAATNTPATSPVLPAGVPDTAAGHQLAWVLASMNKVPAAAEIEPHFSPAFLEKVPLAKLVATADQLALGAPYTLEKVAPSRESDRSLVALVRSSRGQAFTVRLALQRDGGDRIAGLLIRTYVDPKVAASWDEVSETLRGVPFLSTREMFALKLLASPDDQSAYVAADVAHKRKLLDAYGKRSPGEMMEHAPSFTMPVRVDSLEWFASPGDLCRIAIDLQEQAAAPTTAPVGAILSINPGIPDEKRQYRYIGFKGGSEPGVLNMTYLLQRARDDKWLFLSVSFNDTKMAIDDSKAVSAVSTAREFLGR